MEGSDYRQIVTEALPEDQKAGLKHLQPVQMLGAVGKRGSVP